MDDGYEVYCIADPLFYDSMSGCNRVEPFDAARRPVPDGWEREIADNWVVMNPVGASVPQQGWKVHVSACLDNAERILEIVWSYCVPRRIPFKFLVARNAVHLNNAKYAPRESSGKFVTIYPSDVDALGTILHDLGERLAGEPGPYILSDLRWNEGPLYVRYGGFALRHCLSARGDQVPAIEDPTGALVPDRRDAVFFTPPWVTLPDLLVPQLAARNATTVGQLPYRVEQVLHFSNGGGLYEATDQRTGTRVVLKEARPHAGLASDGADAVQRLQRERETLERLAGIKGVPAVHDHFTLGEHHFLALEFIEGKPLNKVFAQRYPLSDPTAGPAEFAAYTEWALRVYAQIEDIITAIHGRGVIHGDLHLFNVIVRDDGRPTLIDFEVATRVGEVRRPTLGSPAFAAPADRTGFDIDRYSLACLRLALFLPLTAMIRLDAGKPADFAEVIAEHFPVPPAFLAEAVQTITGASGTDRDVPRRRARALPPLPDGTTGWTATRDSIVAGILASATPKRTDRLFPGDIAQFTTKAQVNTGGLNIAHGAAGVLYALSATGAAQYLAGEHWLLERAASAKRGMRLGLYDGLHGVAYVLADLGYRQAALDLIEFCLTEPSDQLGTDLSGGLAGVALNLAHFAGLAGEPTLFEHAVRAAEVVADRLGTADSVSTISGGDHPYAGLMQGSSGPALMFLRLYEHTGDRGFLELSATALRQDLRRCLLRDDGSMLVNEGWRAMPYLDRGSAGIGMVLDEYLAHRSDDEFANAAAAIRRAARCPFYIQPGLFSGRAGIILYLSRTYPPGQAVWNQEIAAQIRRLGWHRVDYQGHLAFPGEQLLRLSMDLASGAAGVLLALGAAVHEHPVGLPFLHETRQPPSRIAPVPAVLAAGNGLVSTSIYGGR
ncbi:MAG: class III lanthionine synthetase LanKC [Actinomycetota bacterium]|nr:class III lanthionine synthetase LanKC [Actinomycetota bacterium]